MKTIAIYSRVSTTDQHPEAQLHGLREYAGRRGLEAVEYADHGVSGVKGRRPGLDAMLDAVRRREVDGVVVVKLDRLARSMRHLCELAETFEALGVALVVLDQATDTSTPSGRLLFGVLASVAAFERDLVIERTKAGMAAARRRGARIGRPEVTDAKQRRRIVRLRKAGHPVRKVAEMVGVSAGTVVNVTKRKAA